MFKMQGNHIISTLIFDQTKIREIRKKRTVFLITKAV